MDVATVTEAPTTPVPVAAIILTVLVATDKIVTPALVDEGAVGLPEATPNTLAGYFNALLDPNNLRDATFLTDICSSFIFC